MKAGISFLAFLLMGCICAFSQRKFEKIDIADFDTKVCPIDSSAAAEFIYCMGKTEYVYNGGGVFFLKRKIKARVRVLKEEGKSNADISVIYRFNMKNDYSLNDRVEDVKAIAYNLVDGRVVKTQMTEKYVFTEKIDEERMRVKFSVPAVRVGTIFDYEYVIVHQGFRNLPTWYAQQSLPVRYSYYEVTIPTFFKYYVEDKGFVQAKQGLEEVKLRYSDGGNVTLNTMGEKLTREWENLKPLKDEDFVWCPQYYANSLSFELYGIKYPNSEYKKFTASWDVVRERLREEGRYKTCLTIKNPFSADMKQMNLEGMSAVKKASTIFSFIQKRIKWNGDYRILSDNPLKAVKTGRGSNADLNFIYMSMLREAGVSCTPLLMCLRRSGRLPSEYPSLEKLSTFVVALSDEKGGLFFADCSAEYGDVNVLPLNLLAEGVLYDKTISKIDAEIFDLSFIRGNELNTNIQCSINDDGDIVGTSRNLYKGIEAEKFKQRYHESSDSLAVIDNIERQDGCKLKMYKTKNVDGVGLSTIEQYYFSKAIDKTDDRMFFNPMIFASKRKNYFTEDSREMPVEFQNLQKTEIKALMMLPDGYEVEEIPAARSIKFMDGELEAKIDICLEGKMLTTVYSFSVNTPIVVPQHYTELQKFWKELLDINSLRVVLRKKA